MFPIFPSFVYDEKPGHDPRFAYWNFVERHVSALVFSHFFAAISSRIFDFFWKKIVTVSLRRNETKTSENKFNKFFFNPYKPHVLQLSRILRRNWSAKKMTLNRQHIFLKKNPEFIFMEITPTFDVTCWTIKLKPNSFWRSIIK